MKSRKDTFKYLLLFASVCTILSNTLSTMAIPTYDFSEIAVKEKIIKQSFEQGVDPALTLSLVKQESNFEANARSYVGAIGLFQLMPATAKEMGINPYYVNDNIKGGIKYLKQLKDQFGSNELALAAYNAGPGAVSKHGGIPPYSETRTYVHNIMHTYKNYKKAPDPMIERLRQCQKDTEKSESIKLLVLNDEFDKVFNITGQNDSAYYEMPTVMGFIKNLIGSLFG